MTKERDKFLTELLGYKIHHEPVDYSRTEPRLVGPLNFSTWEGFGKLWNWSQEQKWWSEFRLEALHSNYGQITCQYINPDKFANVVYNYLIKQEVL